MKTYRNLLVSAALLVLTLASSVFAFNGQRKGFVLGFGIGGGLVSWEQKLEGQSWAVQDDEDSEKRGAVLTDFELGYAPSDRLMIVYCNSVTWFRFQVGYKSFRTVASPVTGARVTYFLQPQSPSAFVSGSIGLASLVTPFDSDYESADGVGGGIRIGYEWRRHVLLSLCANLGKVKDEYNFSEVKTTVWSVGLLIEALAY